MFARRSTRGSTLSPSPSPNPGICPACNARPLAVDTATGQHFNYCSRTCAAQAEGRGQNQGGTLCEQCGIRPKFREGARVHQYCGRGCANLAASSGSTSSTVRPRSTYSTISRATSSGPTCRTPGCVSPVFVGANGIPGKYCRGTHRRWGETGCISCRIAPRNGTDVLCLPCYGKALRKAPVLIEVPDDHDNYRNVAMQFQQSWRHETACPEVRAVYKVINTAASLKKYEKYLDGVEAKGNFAAAGGSPGNENRRWHGTRRKCKIGDKGFTAFCADANCALCCIIKTSFDLKFFRGATGWGRFGAGIYTSSTSSKSNDYSRNESNSKWKALLLNKVVVGKGKKLTQDDTTLTKPPAGHDSVLAEVVPGGALNYDELVVYDNDAARPSYLVMYEGS